MENNQESQMLIAHAGDFCYHVLWTGEDEFGKIWTTVPGIHDKFHVFDSYFSYEVDADENPNDLIGTQPEFADAPITEIEFESLMWDITVWT